MFCSWDLGISDSTAIWFWRLSARGVDFIDHYEAHGQPLSHFFDACESTGYGIKCHWLPHDARARTLQTGESVEDQFRAKYPGKVQIGPPLSLLDGIQAARWLLEQPVRFHPRCAEGIEALRAYHYEWDEDTKTFSRKPAHDWSSHTADAFRYAACVFKVTMQRERKDPEPRTLPPGSPLLIPDPPAQWRDPASFSLDELYEAEENATRRIGKRRLQ